MTWLYFKQAFMTPIIQSPSRASGQARKAQSMKPVIIAVVLGLLLLFQVGLVLWIYVQQW